MNWEKLSDEEIFLAVPSEPEKFGEIIDRYEKKIDRYLRRISAASQEERQDLLQEIFLAVYENILSFEKGEKFSPWIYRIAHNKSVDYWRKNQKREGEISVDEHLSFVESRFWKNEVEEEIEKIENQELLKKLFSKLDLKYREIFILRFEEEKSYDEISEILRIPKSTVGVWLNRAKKQLQKEYLKIKEKYE